MIKSIDSDFEPEPMLPQSYDELAISLAKKFLADRKYIELTESDLKNLQILRPDQNLPDLIRQILDLDNSLQTQAIENLALRLPVPDDPIQKKSEFLSAAEEIELRIMALTAVEPWTQFRQSESESAGYQNLVSQILQSDVKIWNGGDDDPLTKPADENNNPGLFEMGVPLLVKLNGKYIWGVMEDLNQSDPESEITKFYVITDEAKNSQISTLVLTNPALTKLFLIRELVGLQSGLKYNLRCKFDDFTEAKDHNIMERIKPFNDQVKIALFNRVFNSAVKGSLGLIKITRDPHDIAVYKGNQQPEQSRKISESGLAEFQISTTLNGELKFTWTENEAWPAEAKIIETKLFSAKNERCEVLVRKNGEKLEFARVNNLHQLGRASQLDWFNEVDERGPELKKIQKLFHEIEVASFDNCLNPAAMAQETAAANQKLAVLNRAENLAEFVNLLNQWKIIDFPRIELIANVGLRVKYQIRQGLSPDFPPPAAKKARDN